MFSILSIPERKGSAASAVFGIAGVVAVLVGVLSIGQGFKKAHGFNRFPGKCNHTKRRG